MSYVSGMFIVDAPASALNNGNPAERTDNVGRVKAIRTPDGTFPYVSAQSLRFWLRETLTTQFSEWRTSPTYKESTNLAYTGADPIEFWDDDLLGYMRAPDAGTKARRKADEKYSKMPPLEEVKKDNKMVEVNLTRVSPFRVGTMVSINPFEPIDDFGTMSRHDGDPVIHRHEFYRVHFSCLFSLDLTSAGTFFDGGRVGFRNLDSYRRDRATQMGCEIFTVRGQPAYRLPIDQRQKRTATLISAIAVLDGGAKQALHYTDVAPSVVFAAVTKNGNHPFARIFSSSRNHKTELNVEALREALSTYNSDFLSPVYVGWAKGFLDEQRANLPEDLKLGPLVHPRDAVMQLAHDLEQPGHQRWYD